MATKKKARPRTNKYLKWQTPPKYYWDEAGEKGRGIYANCDLMKGELIGVAPLLQLSPAESDRRSIFDYYTFQGPTEFSPYSYLALHAFSLLNHSDRFNSVWEISESECLLYLRTYENIKKGTEITINYNWNRDDD